MRKDGRKYHRLYDEFMRCRSQMCETYERATLPINEGETALRNVGFVFSTAFACSLASSKDLAKAFPQWIKLDRNDNFLRIASNRSPDKSHQVETCVKEYRKIFPEGSFQG